MYGIARSNQLYLLIYMALVLLFITLLLTRDTVFSAWSIKASTRLHNRKLSHVLRVLNNLTLQQCDITAHQHKSPLVLCGMAFRLLLVNCWSDPLCCNVSTSSIAWHSVCLAELFRRVLAAPILFFLRTPVGDVLNAFARDQVRNGRLRMCTHE